MPHQDVESLPFLSTLSITRLPFLAQTLLPGMFQWPSKWSKVSSELQRLHVKTSSSLTTQESLHHFPVLQTFSLP
jgi:hypothetical protein